ncbi:MAG: S1 RNA-binding domain-containing protein [Ruminococcaceae bacterium]|nr:S1 RNA-binding domain-containing protein [Oscillospiraceae bacterium]
MERNSYLPEGALLHTEANENAISSISALSNAMEQNLILESPVVLCDAAHNLVVQVGEFQGVIPHTETAIGIDCGTTREIAVISRVGKPVAFHITDISPDGVLTLSRKSAQEEALNFFLHTLHPGDVIPAKVTHLEPFGVFVDIGCGNIALIGIENLSVSRISHPKDRLRVGQEIFAVVRQVDQTLHRITLSQRELLGTWAENAAKFEVGQTVRGIVRGIEDYGVFIELAPNLSGLAEKRDGLEVGDAVSVFIKNITEEKMKIKLIVIDVFGKDQGAQLTQNDYFITRGHLDLWEYSPPVCDKKKIYTVFE